MKQHDLLKILCKAYPNVFTITLSLRDKKVIIDVDKSHWQKIYEYEAFTKMSVEKLAKEILHEYRNARDL